MGRGMGMGMGMALMTIRCDTIRHDQVHRRCAFLSCMIGMISMICMISMISMISTMDDGRWPAGPFWWKKGARREAGLRQGREYLCSEN